MVNNATTSHRALGFALAALAAAAYGTNPAFAVPLYADGMNLNSVLMFRYLLGLPLLASLMAWRGIGFALTRRQLGITALLGILMALSSLGLFESYRYMNSGVASTLLFVYPIMVAVIMVFVCHERLQPSVALCLSIMGAGLWLLMKPAGNAPVSLTGFLLAMISSLTYALYIVFVNTSATARAIPTTKLLFYVLIWGCALFAALIPAGMPLTVPSHSAGWLNLAALAVIPTVLSLACTTRAIQLIGSTPTAILGALEPVVAVVLSIVVLGQSITGYEIAGATLIVVSATLVVCDRAVNAYILRAARMFPRRRGHKS